MTVSTDEVTSRHLSNHQAPGTCQELCDKVLARAKLRQMVELEDIMVLIAAVQATATEVEEGLCQASLIVITELLASQVWMSLGPGSFVRLHLVGVRGPPGISGGLSPLSIGRVPCPLVLCGVPSRDRSLGQRRLGFG